MQHQVMVPFISIRHAAATSGLPARGCNTHQQRAAPFISHRPPPPPCPATPHSSAGRNHEQSLALARAEPQHHHDLASTRCYLRPAARIALQRRASAKGWGPTSPDRARNEPRASAPHRLSAPSSPPCTVPPLCRSTSPSAHRHARLSTTPHLAPHRTKKTSWDASSLPTIFDDSGQGRADLVAFFGWVETPPESPARATREAVFSIAQADTVHPAWPTATVSSAKQRITVQGPTCDSSHNSSRASSSLYDKWRSAMETSGEGHPYRLLRVPHNITLQKLKNMRSGVY